MAYSKRFKGTVYLGELPMVEAAEENPDFQAFMKICDAVRKLKVRTNADTPEDAARFVHSGLKALACLEPSTCSMERILKSRYSNFVK